MRSVCVIVAVILAVTLASAAELHHSSFFRRLATSIPNEITASTSMSVEYNSTTDKYSYAKGVGMVLESTNKQYRLILYNESRRMGANYDPYPSVLMIIKVSKPHEALWTYSGLALGYSRFAYELRLLNGSLELAAANRYGWENEVSTSILLKTPTVRGVVARMMDSGVFAVLDKDGVILWSTPAPTTAAPPTTTTVPTTESPGAANTTTAPMGYRYDVRAQIVLAMNIADLTAANKSAIHEAVAAAMQLPVTAVTNVTFSPGSVIVAFSIVDVIGFTAEVAKRLLNEAISPGSGSALVTDFSAVPDSASASETPIGTDAPSGGNAPSKSDGIPVGVFIGVICAVVVLAVLVSVVVVVLKSRRSGQRVPLSSRMTDEMPSSPGADSKFQTLE